MKVKCIKSIKGINKGDILDISGIVYFEGSFICEYGSVTFGKHFSVIEQKENEMENKNTIKYEGSEFRDKKVEHGMIFETDLGLFMMAQTNEETYQLISLEDGNRVDDTNYKHSKISSVDGNYLGYGTIVVNDFRRE